MTAPILTVRIRVTMPDRKPITIRAEAEIDGGVAGAFDRLIGPLIAELRQRITGETK